MGIGLEVVIYIGMARPVVPVVDLYLPAVHCSWTTSDPGPPSKPCKIEPMSVAREQPKLNGKPKPYYVDLDKHAKKRFR